MKMRKKIMILFVMFCLVSVGVLSVPATAQAKKITSMRDAEKRALKSVKNAVVIETDKDYEKGTLVYEIDLLKGTKEYEITYRASDGKMLSYKWEENRVDRSSRKKIMSRSKVKKLAKKKVKNASITSIQKKRDDGIWVYKIKLNTKSKKYTLEYHARTGKLLEYEWELKKTSKKGNSYIGHEKAKEIALAKVPGATVRKIEFDIDDGVPVYEVELIKDVYEYDIEIHAVTGEILDIDRETREDIIDYYY